MPDLAKKFLARIGVGSLILGFLSLLIVAVSALVLAIGYRNQLDGFRHTVYQRCLQRDAYDRASQDARNALREWFTSHQAEERTNRFIDGDLRDQRVRDDDAVISKLEHTLHVGAPTGCAIYK